MADYQAVAYKAAVSAGVDPALFMGLIKTESGFNPNAINPSTGAAGIAQFLPSTARNAGYGIPSFDPMDAEQSLYNGAKYLKVFIDKYGDEQTAVAKYKGHSDATSAGALADVQKVLESAKGFIDNPLEGSEGADTEMPVNEGVEEVSDKPIWKFSWQELKDSISSSLLGFSIGFIGICVLVFAVYAVIAKQKISIEEVAGV